MPAPLPIRVDPVRDALASIDAPPFELNAALREQHDGADPRSALELLVSEVADGLRRDAREAMPLPGRVNIPSADASALASHLRETLRTRATNPAFHARRLSEARRALARIARVDRFTAERRAAGDVPAEAMLRVLAFARSAWSEVPGGMDGAPEAAPTLAEFVAAHVAHSGRLRARQSDAGHEPGPTRPPMKGDVGRASTPAGTRWKQPKKTPDADARLTRSVPIEFASRVLGLTPDEVVGLVFNSGDLPAHRPSRERFTFDADKFAEWMGRSPRDVDALFACFGKSRREEAEAILQASRRPDGRPMFDRADIDATLARLFPARRVRRKPGR